jgi:sterol desaturase/sphingolipid hydroxylase (fatty acid hydroxylase superfamily)
MIDLQRYFVDNLFISLSLVLGVYSLVYFIFNGYEPTKLVLQKYRFNQAKYPDRLIVDLEILRTTRSVLISCLIDAFIVYQREKYGWFPLLTGDQWSFQAFLNEVFSRPLRTISVGGLMLLWADFHFYFTHRLLHTHYLFTHVHSVHHQSKNPNAYSGLSFHWLEAAIYFSSLFGCLFIPMSLASYSVLKWGLLLAPAGHNSAGPLPHGKRYPQVWEDHYLHHIIVTKNYGSGLLPFNGIWDNLLGTTYIQGDFREGEKQQE